MSLAYIQFNGKPGETWENQGEKIVYQLLVSWHNSCGVCIQYDHAISKSSWPIPFHFSCRCHQLPVFPGKKSEPFVDYREKIQELDHGQKTRVLGASNMRLIEKGVVEWSDVVTEGRIRDFREVVHLRRLDAGALEKAGVPKRYAEAALKAVNTPAAQAVDESRKRIIEAMRAKGYSDEQIRKLTGERLAARVTIRGFEGEPPQGPQPPPAIPPGPKPKSGSPPKPMHGEQLELNFDAKLTPKGKAAIREGAKPSGKPVAEAIKLPRGETKDRMAATIEAIDSVHGDGALEVTPISVKSMKGLGEFSWKGGKSVRISIHKAGDHQELTLVHEVGHFLDFFGVPGGRPGSRAERDRTKDPRFAEWLGAIKESGAHKALTEKLKERLEKSKLDFTKYLLSPEELWARSYAQYIALRSSSPVLKTQLDKLRQRAELVQWADDEFTSIAEAMDDLFLKLGWRTPR
jgi:hypothetical protein